MGCSASDTYSPGQGAKFLYKSKSHHSKAKGGRKKASPFVYKCGDEARNAVQNKTIKTENGGAFLMLRFWNKSSKKVKYDFISDEGNCQTYSEQDAGKDYYEQTSYKSAWAFRDSQTGIVHAVFQQNTDYNKKNEYTIFVKDDGNGGLFLEYDPAPQAAEVEDSPEEEQPDLEDYDQQGELEQKDDLFKEWNSKWEAMKKKCDDIIAAGTPWTDPEFGGQSALWKDDEYRTRPSLDHDEWKKLQWKRAGDILPNYKLFSQSIQPNDIKQGGIGDCYFVASVAALAEVPNRIRAVFYNKSANDAGCYLLKFYLNGVPTGVMIDDIFLTDGSNLIFAQSVDKELWVPLIEKAWAKVLGSYTRANGGGEDEALHTLIGTPVKKIDHKELRTDKIKKEKHWEVLKSLDQQDFIMTIASEEAKAPEETKDDGIARAHAFSLLAVNEFLHQGKQIRLCKVRNPWGFYEWKGAWSDNSKDWTPELDAMLNHTNEEDGTFFMPYDDMLRIYANATICCNPDPKIYTHQKRLIDFNTSEFPNVAFLRFELAADVELTTETFAVFCNQQGDNMNARTRYQDKMVPPFIEVLVFDSQNKMMFASRDARYLSYPSILTEQTTLKAGGYTMIIRPDWDSFRETSASNPAEYRKVLVGIFYPRKANFSKLSVVDAKTGGLYFARGMKQIIKDNFGKGDQVSSAQNMDIDLYGSFGKKTLYSGYSEYFIRCSHQVVLYENLAGSPKQMAFRYKIDCNNLVFCIPMTMNDNNQVQIVDCIGTYEVIVPPNGDCLVISIIKDSKVNGTRENIQNFELIQ